MIKNIALHITLTCFVLIGASAARADERTTALGGPKAPSPAVLADIVKWVSDSLDLPAVAEHPRIEFVPPHKLSAMRYKNLLGTALQTPNGETAASGSAYRREVVALYEDATRTVFLPVGWTGKTPAEISILVHEMVHHLQNLAGIKYECPAAREKPAYRAQDRWLRAHGLDLEQEFELDRFTIFVGSTCLG